MRAKKWLTFSTAICIIVSIILMIVFQCNHIKIGYDIALAMLGSALLGFVMSLIEYFSERRSSMERFWLEARKVLSQFRKAKPIVISDPEELVIDSLAEEIHNKQVETWGEEIANSIGLKKEDTAKKAYIEWLESHEEIGFSENDNISGIFEKIYNRHIEQNRAHIVSIIDNYIELSQISLSKLDSAYGDLDFLFGNRRIRRKAYDEIFNKIREIKKSICLETFHFNLWKEGEGNFIVCTRKAMEINKTLFKSIISESNGLKQECIYQGAFDEIEESLEDFRIKIYWSKKRDPIEHFPVMGRVISIEKER